MRKRKQPQVNPFAGYQGPRTGNVAPPWGSAPLPRAAEQSSQQAGGAGRDGAGGAPHQQRQQGAGTSTVADPQQPPGAAPPPPAIPDSPPDTGRTGQPSESSNKTKARKPKRRERRQEVLGGTVQINTHRSDLAARAMRGSLWGVMALVVVCVLALVLHEGRSVTPPPAKEVAPPAGGASGFAAVFMQQWLPAGEGTESDLEPYMSNVPTLTNKPETRFATGTPIVLSAQQVRDGYWSVLLAVNESTKDDKGKMKAAGLHWYRVSVAEEGTSGNASGANDTVVWQVTGPPFEVPAPTAADTLTDSPYSATNVSTSGPIGETAQQFLNAYLVGDGELARYTSPGAGIAPVTPPSATKVSLTSIDAMPTKDDVQDSENVPPTGTTVRILVHASVTGSGDAEVPMDYPLTLRSRAGRWEVASIDPAPASEGRTSAPDRQTPDATAPDHPSGSASSTP